MKKKKILYIHHGWGIGGAPISLLNLILEIDKYKYNPIVLFTHSSEAIDLFTKHGINTLVETSHNKYFRHHQKGKLKFYQVYKALTIILDWFYVAFIIAPRIYSEVNPDLIHLNSEVLLNWAYAGRRKGLPVVCHNRDPLANGIIGFRKTIIRYLLLKNVNSIISISEDNSKRINLPNTTIVYNPISKLFFEQQEKNKYSSKKILFVGGMHKAKGLSLLMKITKHLSPGIKLVLAGYYPNESKKNKIKYYKFFRFLRDYKNQVKLIGLLTNEEIAEEMSKSQLIIFPALHPHFPRPIIESYATKTPVIASKLIGMDEVVKDEITGFLVPPNALLFAKKINGIVENLAKLKEMGDAGFLFAKQNFTAQLSASKVQMIYSKLL